MAPTGSCRPLSVARTTNHVTTCHTCDAHLRALTHPSPTMPCYFLSRDAFTGTDTRPTLEREWEKEKMIWSGSLKKQRDGESLCPQQYKWKHIKSTEYCSVNTRVLWTPSVQLPSPPTLNFMKKNEDNPLPLVAAPPPNNKKSSNVWQRETEQANFHKLQSAE
jgi:hypothetical protein